ncbi:MAG: SUMF1/EgtB/PvdO family nonheme iron enzyme [Bacteroidaceae bacterium]|nr:SUMF1/EgtB/PvdO family nonheme iron enzyme [Bacteroidaceae bacterium]
MKVEPKNATLMIEGKIKTLQNGQYTELLSKGSYRYEVNAEGHVSQNGTIVVDDDTQPLTIQLQSIVSTIDVVRQTFTVNGVSFNMILVEGGTFQMGATEEQLDDADNDEKPVHNVTLNDFMIGETEVTQELWEAVMDMNPSYFKGAKNPVERVNWLDCQEFISKLYSLTGERFRLPTEAEWEYAARGGNKSRKTKYSGSNTVDDVAWYVGNSSDTTHPVGTKQMNELGIYDMSGNVEEFCEDWYGEAYYSNSPHYHPKGPSQGSYRVVRGGCWFYGKQFCRVSNRDDEIPDRGERSSLLGLRFACSLNEDNDSDTNTIERHDKETASLSGNKASVEVPTEQSAKDASKATIVEEKDNIIPVNNNSIDEPVLVDGIEYPCETPTVEQIKEWGKKNASLCASKISDLSADLSIPKDIINYHPCLVYLILTSKSMAEKQEQQKWFDLYSMMNEEQLYKLYDILYREHYKLGIINKKNARGGDGNTR